MWPSLSHTKPEPVPWGICWTSRLNGPAAVTSVVIWTTEGDAVRKISIVVRSISARSPRATTGRSTASGSRSRQGLGMTVQIVHSASAATSISRTALSPSGRRSNRLSLVHVGSHVLRRRTAICASSEAPRRTHVPGTGPRWRAEGRSPRRTSCGAARRPSEVGTRPEKSRKECQLRSGTPGRAQAPK